MFLLNTRGFPSDKFIISDSGTSFNDNLKGVFIMQEIDVVKEVLDFLHAL